MVYPLVAIPGFEPSQISSDLTQILADLQSSLDKLNEIFGGIEGLQTTLDAILVDMVGEVTFLASIAELNAAIAALAEDIDVAITALGAALAAAIAAQTAALIANLNANFNGIAFKLDTVNSNLTTISGRLATIQVDMQTIINQISTLNANLLAGFSAVNANLSVINSSVQDVVTQCSLVNSRLAAIFSAVDFYFPKYRILLQDVADNTDGTNSLLLTTNDRLLTLVNSANTTNTKLDSIIAILSQLGRPSPSDPQLYDLLYGLWQALSFGGFFTAGVGSGKLNVQT